jgi:hypothetical protein
MAIRSRRASGTIVLLVLVIAACSGATSGSASPTATPEPTTAASDPGPAASVTPAPGGALEDLVPSQVGGIQLVKRTVHGPDIGELDPEEAANFAKVLENVEGPLEAFASVSATGPGLAISAWRMEGTDGGQLGDAFIAFVQGLGKAEVTDVTIGGKEVKRITPANTTPLQVYVMGEVMFVVQAEDEAVVEEAFALLP